MQREHPSQRCWGLSDLHESLLHLILARLDVFSLPSCAQVCKTWFFIIARSPTFARLHASLHTFHTWFPLFTSTSMNSMAFYDSLAHRCVSTRCLDLVDGSSMDMPHISPEQREQVKQLRRDLFNEELLATSEGLVLSRSEYNDNLTVTNILTRKSKLLPAPNPQLCHIAFVGMAYMWETMSYHVLLCGLLPLPNPQGCLFTCVYNSLTHCWTAATSTLSTALYWIPGNKSAEPRTCVWFKGHFYCVMGTALYLFDLVTMEWGSVYSLPLHKAVNQPCKSVQVQLPSELICFYCLWEHKGELRLAGLVKTEESKFVTQLWCMSQSLQTGCGMSQWQDLARFPMIASRTNIGRPFRESALGRRWYAHGDALCLSIINEDINGSYRRILDTSKVHFYVHDLMKGDLKIVKIITHKTVCRDVLLPTNLTIQPCPFTSP